MCTGPDASRCRSLEIEITSGSSTLSMKPLGLRSGCFLKQRAAGTACRTVVRRITRRRGRATRYGSAPVKWPGIMPFETSSD